MPCSLCNCNTREFDVSNERVFVQCSSCKAILLLPEFFISPQEEKFRYSLHNNDVSDPRYIKFVNPIVDSIKKDFKPDALGLDFGCGTGPVITSELRKLGFEMNLYDPYFHPQKKVLEETYDFIVCCEVMEHFKDPLAEFRLLRFMLNDQAKLYCKTAIWDESIGFKDWHYKNDLTHVIFYNRETLKWIKENLNFSNLEVFDDHIVFSA